MGEVVRPARKLAIRRNLSKLDTPHRTICQIIYEAGEIGAANSPTASTTSWDKVTSSERATCSVAGEYLVIESEGENRWAAHRPLEDVSLESVDA